MIKYILIFALGILGGYAHSKYNEMKLEMFRAGCTYVDAPIEEITKCRNRAEAYMEGSI